MKGQGGGGTAKGGGKVRSGGGDVVIKKTKAMQTKAINENVLKLRAALFDDAGKDKNVLEGIAASFLHYERNGVSLDISFSPKLKKEEAEWAFDLSQSNMEEIYDASGYGWDDADKERELTEQGARFLLIRESGSNALKGFVHFRFTVQGEVIDQMIGQTCLYILDLHLEDDVQRKGVGKHLLILLELIARKQLMSRITFPIYLGDEKTKNWLLKQGKGFVPDISYAVFGFEPEAEGFEVYSKEFVQPTPAPAMIPTSVFQNLKISEKENASPDNISHPIPPNNEAVKTEVIVDDSSKVEESKVSDNSSQEEEIVVNMESIIAELKALYVEKHGENPPDDIIEKWRQEVQDTAAVALQEGEEVVAE